MATETQMAPNREIDDVLKQTDLGSWIGQNKNLAIALVVILLGGIFGWGGYTQIKNKQEQELGKQIYTFQEAAYTQLVDKKIKPADYLAKFKVLQSETGNYIGLAPLLIKSAGHLTEQGALKEAIEILESGLMTLKTPVLNNILSLKLAANLEDQKEYTRAIKVLEDLNTSSLKLMEDKVYLDLGRLYISSGNKEKAKTNLQYLVDNGKEVEFIKLAKLYLEDIK